MDEVDEIGHMALIDPIQQVADRPAQDQRQPAANQPVVHRREKVVDRHDPDRDHSRNGQHRVLSAEDAERAAVVGDVRESEELRQPFAVAQFQSLAQNHLGDLVEDDHERRQHDEAAVWSVASGLCGNRFRRRFALNLWDQIGHASRLHSPTRDSDNLSVLCVDRGAGL